MQMMMRKLFCLIATIFWVGFTFAQDTQNLVPKDGPVITFEKKSHDFGDIVQGDKVEHTFSFTNTGSEPLIITNVQVTCGCTTPKGWPRDPILPGHSGEISVGFSSSNKIGRQHKPITIISNAANKDGVQISITTNILPAPGSD
jgi:hypothetical protein